MNEFPKYIFCRWRNFIEVVGWSPFTHLDQETINWAMEKAAKEIEKPGRRAAFIYGVASITDDGGKSRVFFETNTGGENSCQFILMLKFFDCLRDLLSKPGAREWIATIPWRHRMLIKIAVWLAKPGV